jgi:hypothetical protein
MVELPRLLPPPAFAVLVDAMLIADELGFQR